MKKYRVGIVGYGWAAGAHIPAINASPLAQVTTICSSRQLNARELSTHHGCDLRTTPSLDALLDDSEVDVVSICSYHAQHAHQVIAAAEAGKHIICEKPLALSLKDVRAIERAVRKAGVGFCLCFELRFSSQFRAIKSLLDQGLLGTLHYAEVDYYHGIGPWYAQYRWNTRKDAGGSALLTAGCHALDALRLCMGDAEAADVQSFAAFSASSHFRDYEYPTTSVTIVKFKDGRIGKCTASVDCLQPYYFHTHLVGSEGSLLDNKFHSMKIHGLDKSKWSELSMKMLDSGDVSDHPYRTQFDAFFTSIDQGKDMPLTSLGEALRTHELIFRADAAAAKNGVKRPKPSRIADHE